MPIPMTEVSFMTTPEPLDLQVRRSRCPPGAGRKHFKESLSVRAGASSVYRRSLSGSVQGLDCGANAERGDPMLQLVMRSRGEMLRRAIKGANTWLIPTSRAKLLKEAATPKSAGQKRVEGALQELASGAGRAKLLAKVAAGGTVAYLASKVVGGAGAVVFNESKRRVQSATNSLGVSKSRSRRGGGGNSPSRTSTAKSSGGKNSSSRSQGSRSGNRKKAASRGTSTVRKSSSRGKTTARKKPTPRKSTSRKKTTSRKS
jgi:hypothetical protein